MWDGAAEHGGRTRNKTVNPLLSPAQRVHQRGHRAPTPTVPQTEREQHARRVAGYMGRVLELSEDEYSSMLDNERVTSRD